MKKIWLLLSIAFSLVLVGCSQGEYKNVSVSDIEKAIEKSNLLLEHSTTIDITETDYFNDVKELIIEGYITRPTSNLHLEDIIVIKCESENIDAIYEQVQSYKKNMVVNIFGNGLSSEENGSIASNTIVEKKGDYVYLISAKNAQEIEATILDVITK